MAKPLVAGPGKPSRRRRVAKLLVLAGVGAWLTHFAHAHYHTRPPRTGRTPADWRPCHPTLPDGDRTADLFAALRALTAR